MSETVAKLDILTGIQINRSTWVAFSVVKTLVKTNASIELHLTNGAIETVAAVRRHAVNAAYELYLRQKGQ
jgi:ribosomal protein L19